MSEKKRPPVKKTTQEVLREIAQGKENAEEFGQRCKITDEELNMRVIHHNRDLETDSSLDIQRLRDIKNTQQRINEAIKKGRQFGSRIRIRPEDLHQRCTI